MSWTGADLAQRGTVRFTELLQTLEPLRFWSTDRYTTRLAGQGLGGAHSLGPAVVVDGLPFSSQFMDRTEYELIPIGPRDIALLSFQPGWTMLPDGRMADGVLRISTLKPQGFSVRGSVGLTNETGDPGPSIYSNPAAKNVDRSGPTAGLRLSWGSPTWYVQAGLDSDAFHMTDARVEGRVWSIFAGEVKPVISHVTQSVRISHASEKHSLELWGGQTVKNNFLFDELAGLEWPLKEERVWLHGNSTYALSKKWKIGVSGDLGTWETQNLKAQIDLPDKLSIEDYRAEFQLQYATPTFSAVWAGGGRKSKLSQLNGGQLRSLSIVHARSEMNLGLTTKSHLKILGSVSAPSAQISDLTQMSYLAQFSYLAGTELAHEKPSSGWLRLGLTVRSDIVEDVWTTLDLIESGATFGQWAPNFVVPVYDSRAETIEVSLSSSSVVGRNLLFWIDLRARRLSGLTIPDRNFINKGPDLGFRSESDYKIGHQGTVASPTVGFTYKSDLARLEISYQYIRLIADGDLLFWKNFSGLSPHRLRSTLLVNPTPRLHLFASLRIENRSLWPEYPSLESSRVPGFVQLDGTLSKELWNDNISLSFSVINLLNRHIVKHPSGVDEQMAVRLGVSVRFSKHDGHYP